MVPEEGRMLDERPLFCVFDPARPERGPLSEDRLELRFLSVFPMDLRWELSLFVIGLSEILSPDRLPGPGCFLVGVLFDLCPLPRRAVAICFMMS
jgi:hypothetical protein